MLERWVIPTVDGFGQPNYEAFERTRDIDSAFGKLSIVENEVLEDTA